jgi:hypothetical protein
MLVYNYTKKINEIKEENMNLQRKGKEIVTQPRRVLGEVLRMDLGSVSPCFW